jgi:hypothetical protein
MRVLALLVLACSAIIVNSQIIAPLPPLGFAGLGLPFFPPFFGGFFPRFFPGFGFPFGFGLGFRRFGFGRFGRFGRDVESIKTEFFCFKLYL